jgi:hypothetical protein
MPPTVVPEIVASTGMSAMALLTGAVAVIRGRRKKVSDPRKSSPASLLPKPAQRNISKPR